MHLSGCGGVTRALTRVTRGHPCVQVEPSARVGSASALRDMGDPTVTDPRVLRIVE